MKIQLETITSAFNKSFSLMYNPNLSDLFFWHFHPEYELVYIEGASGTRHVGDHISTFENNDLVLIGSNIPHLNFDYGIKTSYQKVVIHLKKDFVESHILETPELSTIVPVFKNSTYGIAFKGALKKKIGERLFHFPKWSPFRQYLELLDILFHLSTSNEFELLHETPYTKKYSERDQGRLRTIYAYIDKNYHQKIELEEIASVSNLTKEAFCRYFKKVTGNTFIEFLNRYRISQSKRILISGKSVSEACYKCGFESLSYFNRTFKRVTQENPSDFKRRYT